MRGGAPAGARTKLVPEYDTFETADPGEAAPLQRAPRPKPKGVGAITWLALITFAIIVVSLLDNHRRSVRRGGGGCRQEGRQAAQKQRARPKRCM